MDPAARLSALARFGDYEVDFEAGELRKHGLRIKLQYQPFRILTLLLERPGRLVSREEFQKLLWPNDTVVEFEHGINAAINRLREALSDSAEEPRYVETLPRRGYRFIYPVAPVSPPATGAAVGTPPLQPDGVQPAVEDAACVESASSAELLGQTVSRFRILERLGGGGMGVVYRAEDTQLGREVAIKFLPAELAAEPRALDRFQREARAASALDHPNICTLYEIGEHGGRPFIVMPLLKGQTLKQRISVAAMSPSPLGTPVRTPALQLDEFLDLALQIADALEAAHAKGIIHRDIKPANVFVTESGQAKVLDFGLAKLVHERAAEPSESQSPELATPSPTKASSIHDSITRTGVAVGTPAYMSPEQVRREELDTRTDLFSFGAVLYEMATGRQPFAGETAAEVEQAIVTQPPAPATEINPALPAKLQEIILKALEKNREQRYQSAADLRTDLVAVGATRGVAQGEVPPRPYKLAVLAGAALAVVIAALLALNVAGLRDRLLGPGPRVPSRPLNSVPFTSFPGVEDSPSFSPDGNQIAFHWNGEGRDNWDIYVMMVGTSSPLRLTTNPAPDVFPAWSRDGRQIAFLRGPDFRGEVYVISALGGPERKVYDSKQWISGVSWAPDGKSLTLSERSSADGPYRIVTLSLETLEATPLTSPPQQSLGDRVPVYSPDGKMLAFARSPKFLVEDVWAQPVSGGEARRLTSEGFTMIAGLAWTPDNRDIVFSGWARSLGGYTLWRVSRSGGGQEAIPGIGEGAFFPSISHQGSRLAYSSISPIRNDIWRLPGPKSAQPSHAPTPIIASSRVDGNPDFSPDGKKIAFGSNRSGQFNIWVSDSDGSNPIQLTDLEGQSGTPRWSPDGKWIAFDSRPGEDSEIYVIRAEGGTPRRLTNHPADDVTPSWSRDGKWIYFGSDRSGEYQVWKMAAERREPVQVTRGGGLYAMESLDGQSLFFSKSGGLDFPGDGLWKMPVGGGEETRILDRKLRFMDWDLAEGGIYVLKKKRRTVGEEWFIELLDPGTGKMTLLYRRDGPNYHEDLAVSPDERWILYGESHPGEADIMLAENFR